MDVVPSRRRIRFGTFEMDVSAGELFKDGLKIRLQEQPLQILQFFLERPGEVLTRSSKKTLGSMHRRMPLWGETNKPFESSSETAVALQTAALQDCHGSASTGALTPFVLIQGLKHWKGAQTIRIPSKCYRTRGVSGAP